MLHHIIVKFNDNINPSQKSQIIKEASELFQGLTKIEGIHDVCLHPSCIDRPNRFDLMIVIDMNKDALSTYDDCAIHHTWKTDFSKYIKNKTIFDYE